MPPRHRADTDFTVTRVTTKRAQALRGALTPAELKLWQQIKGRQLNAIQFRRQHAIGPFIADFYCAAVKLAIELDGGSHGGDETEAYDARRTAYFASKGVSVLRFTNSDVHRDVRSIVEQIEHEVMALTAARASLP